MRVLLFIFIAVFLPSVVFAGGDAWPVHVVSIKEQSDRCVLIQLAPTERGKNIPLSCKIFEVKSCYDWSWWNPNKPMSRDEHNQAIGFLRHAEISNTAVYFGEMGEGFGGVVTGKECHVSSSGLQIYDKEVYSFYKWP